ncbi:MAG: ABC transporter substrate-binding protein [Rhodospirillales bacterium]|nr:ABC transporter substrate-binding protein [Rhodospirillales bacterium]
MISRRFSQAACKGLALLFIVALPLGLPTTAAASLEDKAGDFIRSLSQEAVSALTRTDTPREERIKKFRVLFKKHFAVGAIGHFVLGRNWKNATKDERTEYLKLFEDLMVVSYVDRFQRYAGVKLDIARVRTENATNVTVFSVLPRDTGKPVNVLWRVGARVGPEGDILKILDVIIEGASMSQTLRSDFASIIRQKDGKVSGLLEELRIKTAALKAAEAKNVQK